MVIKKYTAFLWQWAWLIVLGTAVAGGAAFIFSKNTTPVYRSTAILLVDEAPGAADAQPQRGQSLALTYAEIIRTQPVLRETLDRLNLSFSADKLSDMISISVPENTQTIVVNVEDINSERAALIANAICQVFIDQNRARNNLRYAESITNWQQNVAEANAEIDDLKAQISPLKVTETPQTQMAINRLEYQLDNAQTRYQEALNKLNELQAIQARESDIVFQIESARPNNSPILPLTIRNTVVSAIIGGIAATGVVLLAGRSNATVAAPGRRNAESPATVASEWPASPQSSPIIDVTTSSSD